MDRRLLFVLTLTVLGICGCSREKAPPPAMTAAAPVKAEMRAPEAASAEASQEGTSVGVAGIGLSGIGSGGGGASAERVSSNSASSDLFASGIQPAPPPAAEMPTAPVTTDIAAAAAAQQQQELADRARAEEARRRALEELQSASVLGALGSSAGKGGEPPHPLAPSETHDHNPLRADAPPRLAPDPTSQNPLRQTSREPRIPSVESSPFPPPANPPPTNPASQEIVPGSGLPVVDNFPAGGSAPPVATPPIESQAPKVAAADRETLAGGAPPPPTTARTAQAAPLAPTAIAENQFDKVEVFYGTDRQAAEQKASDWWHLFAQFLPPLAIGFVAVGLIIVAVGRRNWLLGTVATVGLATCVLLGYEAGGDVLARIRGANKVGPRYTTDRSTNGQIEVGHCEVTVPKSHAVGELESPSIFRLEVSEDISQHLVLQKTEQLASPQFYELLRQRVEQSARRELFVFVHGFNVSFEDAARRTAQIHYDLKFDGPPIFFSWPANDKFIFTYPADETNVAWSVPHLKQFLLGIVKESQARSINLIAHSMGNRALAAALREIELELHDQARLFNQVILAAPDIDADDFRNNIAPAMQRTARGLTLYASSHDEALLASQFIHRRPRAGDAGDGLTVVAGVDTIDVTAIDQSFFGHSYYGSSHPVLNDLRALLSGAIPPRDRTWLSPAERDGLTYWIFQPAHGSRREQLKSIKKRDESVIYDWGLMIWDLVL